MLNYTKGASANYRMLYIDLDVQYVAFNGFCTQQCFQTHDHHVVLSPARPSVLSARVRTCLGYVPMLLFTI